jgi:O-antigen/teichoic acid export membrane protein
MRQKKTFKRFKTISLYGLSQLLGVTSILLLSLLVVKFHSVELWGVYAEILIWSNFFLLFLAFGNHDYLLKAFSNSPSTINQQWTNNVLARSLLLIPSFVLIYFIPAFNALEILMMFLLFFQFLSQSFKVLIVYHRKFTLTIWIELAYNIILFILVISLLETLTIKTLLLILVIAQGVRFIGYAAFFLKDFQNIIFRFQYMNIQKSIPFFIPLAVGTIRTKVDAYYGVHFFSIVNLSKYQIFLSFLALAQMTSSFAITPYLKNFYRSKNTLILKVQKQFFIYGWVFALLMCGIMFIVISKIYELDFTDNQYILAFIFMIPLFLHVLLVNEYYKRDKQNKIALFASIVVILQIIAGYFLIKYWDMNGALLLKAFGQWAIVGILWLWIRKTNNND